LLLLFAKEIFKKNIRDNWFRLSQQDNADIIGKLAPLWIVAADKNYIG
jgi:hypothetical protein